MRRLEQQANPGAYSAEELEREYDEAHEYYVNIMQPLCVANANDFTEFFDGVHPDGSRKPCVGSDGDSRSGGDSEAEDDEAESDGYSR